LKSDPATPSSGPLQTPLQLWRQFSGGKAYCQGIGDGAHREKNHNDEDLSSIHREAATSPGEARSVHVCSTALCLVLPDVDVVCNIATAKAQARGPC